MRLSFKTLFLSVLEVLVRVQGPGDSMLLEVVGLVPLIR